MCSLGNMIDIFLCRLLLVLYRVQRQVALMSRRRLSLRYTVITWQKPWVLVCLIMLCFSFTNNQSFILMLNWWILIKQWSYLIVSPNTFFSILLPLKLDSFSFDVVYTYFVVLIWIPKTKNSEAFWGKKIFSFMWWFMLIVLFVVCIKCAKIFQIVKITFTCSLILIVTALCL